MTLVKVVKRVVSGAGASLLLTATALAQTTPVDPTSPEGLPTDLTSVSGIIGVIFKVVIAAAGAIFIVLFLVGGIQYLTASGNEEATAKARKLLVDSIAGLIIVLAAWAIGTWILGSVGLGSDISQPYSYLVNTLA